MTILDHNDAWRSLLPQLPTLADPLVRATNLHPYAPSTGGHPIYGWDLSDVLARPGASQACLAGEIARPYGFLRVAPFLSAAYWRTALDGYAAWAPPLTLEAWTTQDLEHCWTLLPQVVALRDETPLDLLGARVPTWAVAQLRLYYLLQRWLDTAAVPYITEYDPTLWKPDEIGARTWALGLRLIAACSRAGVFDLIPASLAGDRDRALAFVRACTRFYIEGRGLCLHSRPRPTDVPPVPAGHVYAIPAQEAWVAVGAWEMHEELRRLDLFEEDRRNLFAIAHDLSAFVAAHLGEDSRLPWVVSWSEPFSRMIGPDATPGEPHDAGFDTSHWAYRALCLASNPNGPALAAIIAAHRYDADARRWLTDADGKTILGETP